jgi:hypothetical protein
MKIIKTLITIILLNSSSQAAEKSAQLIELFSSEGCSSCPPAEEQLAKLVNHPNLWKTFVPLNFHVDYWNSLGWTDRYSNSEFTQRQHKYARIWKTASVYTPAFVSNGVSLGSQLDLKILENSGKENHKINIATTTEIKKDEYIISTVFKNLDPKKSYFVHSVLLGMDLVSNVLSGENKGKKLIQNFVVLKLKENIQLSESGSIIFKKPEGSKTSKYAFAVWVTEKNESVSLQSAGGFL